MCFALHLGDRSGRPSDAPRLKEKAPGDGDGVGDGAAPAAPAPAPAPRRRASRYSPP